MYLTLPMAVQAADRLARIFNQPVVIERENINGRIVSWHPRVVTERCVPDYVQLINQGDIGVCCIVHPPPA
jgi:hypothetical protein